jgi:hypothetical protein
MNYFVGGVCCGGVGGAGGEWLSGGKVLSRNSSRTAALAGLMAWNSKSAAFWMVNRNRGSRPEKPGNGKNRTVWCERIPCTIARLRGCAFSGEALTVHESRHRLRGEVQWNRAKMSSGF